MPNATTATNIVARNAGISAGKNVRNIDFKTSVIRRYALSLQAKCSMCVKFSPMFFTAPKQVVILDVGYGSTKKILQR
jgi:hypothetical protein